MLYTSESLFAFFYIREGTYRMISQGLMIKTRVFARRESVFTYVDIASRLFLHIVRSRLRVRCQSARRTRNLSPVILSKPSAHNT